VPLLSIDEALERVLDNVRPLGDETVAIGDASGRILARDALARTDLPPFPSSAMDGFAVRASETPAALPIAFRVAAGTPPPGPLPQASTAEISTGGAVPDAADAVVPIEDVVVRDGVVDVPAARSGAHVRPRGGDVREGAVVVAAGVRLGPAQVGALAAAGVADVRCFVQPRVVILATGSELRPAGEPLAPGQIYESNRTMLAASLSSTGVVEQLPVVADDEAAHRAALERGLEADVLVTTGGVSVGPHDLVRRALEELGVREVFWGVAVKPGKPLSFGVRGRTLVFGLPGNPVSSLVGATLFVRPALLALQGAADPHPRYGTGILATTLRRSSARDEFVRARRTLAGDTATLEPVSGQESHMIVRAAAADALVHVPRGDGDIAAGSSVRYLDLGYE
jgi:molybdopterin molybdotransferase